MGFRPPGGSTGIKSCAQAQGFDENSSFSAMSGWQGVPRSYFSSSSKSMQCLHASRFWHACAGTACARRIQCAAHRPPCWGRFAPKMGTREGLLKYFEPKTTDRQAPECAQNRSQTGLSGGSMGLPGGSRAGPGGPCRVPGDPGGSPGAQRYLEDGSHDLSWDQLRANLGQLGASLRSGTAQDRSRGFLEVVRDPPGVPRNLLSDCPEGLGNRFLRGRAVGCLPCTKNSLFFDRFSDMLRTKNR